MKKIFKFIALAIILIALIIGLTACGNKSKTEENNNDSIISKMSNQEKEAFNSQFEIYEGNDINATNIRMLLMSVKSSNASDKNPQIELKGVNDASNVSSKKSYKVSIEKDRNGVVSVITIEEK